MTREERTEALEKLLTWCCDRIWDLGLDGGDVQDELHNLGLIEEFTITEADQDLLGDFEVGETAYRPTPKP